MTGDSCAVFAIFILRLFSSRFLTSIGLPVAALLRYKTLPFVFVSPQEQDDAVNPEFAIEKRHRQRALLLGEVKRAQGNRKEWGDRKLNKVVPWSCFE